MSTHTAAKPDFRKSSYSGDQNCVEVAKNLPTVLVRDSKNEGGSVLALPRPIWTQFVVAARDGEFDL